MCICLILNKKIHIEMKRFLINISLKESNTFETGKWVPGRVSREERGKCHSYTIIRNNHL